MEVKLYFLTPVPLLSLCNRVMRWGGTETTKIIVTELFF